MTLPSPNKGFSKEIILGWLLVGGILALIYFCQQHEKEVGAFTIAPGSATTLTESSYSENLLPNSAAFHPVRSSEHI